MSASPFDTGKPSPSLAGEEAALQRTVTVTQIRMALGAAAKNLGAAIVAMLLMLAGTSYSRLDGGFAVAPAAMAWGLVVLVLMLSGIAISLVAKRAPPTEETTFRMGRVYLANAALSAAAWGSTSWLLLPTARPEQEGFLLALMTMILAGGGGAQAIYRPLVRTFLVTLTVVFVAGLLRFADLYHGIVALGYVVYTLAIVMYAADQEAAVVTTIRLSLTNEALLVKRTEQQQAALSAQADAEQARAEAEKAVRAKTTFMAAASHDLRQPLHAMVQYVAHLRRTDTDPASAPTLLKLEESVSAMADLLNAVLDHSKIATGSVKPVLAHVQLQDALNRLETQLRPTAEAKVLRLRIEPTDAWVHSDPALLDRVLQNLVHNALRYTHAGTVAVRAVQHAERVRVLVSDSGIGIAPSEQGRIFEDYYQVDNPARDRQKGLGLGLAIVRDLAELLALRVRVRSRVGHGSTFAVDIARATPSPADRSPGPYSATPDRVRGAFIVLIDDDALARDGLALTLTDFGCRVLAVASGAEAVHPLASVEFAPQAVVSDLRLAGGTTGLEAIGLVRAHQQALLGEDFPLAALVISGDTSPDELARVAAAGHRMLHKPIGTEALHGALNDELSALAARRQSA